MLLLLAVPRPRRVLMYVAVRYPQTPAMASAPLLATTAFAVVLDLATASRGASVAALAVPRAAHHARCLVIDQWLGAPLSLDGLFGYSPLVGARYYGIGNEGAGVLFGAARHRLALAVRHVAADAAGRATAQRRGAFPLLGSSRWSRAPRRSSARTSAWRSGGRSPSRSRGGGMHRAEGGLAARRRSRLLAVVLRRRRARGRRPARRGGRDASRPVARRRRARAGPGSCGRSSPQGRDERAGPALDELDAALRWRSSPLLAYVRVAAAGRLPRHARSSSPDFAAGAVRVAHRRRRDRRTSPRTRASSCRRCCCSSRGRACVYLMLVAADRGGRRERRTPALSRHRRCCWWALPLLAGTAGSPARRATRRGAACATTAASTCRSVSAGRGSRAAASVVLGRAAAVWSAMRPAAGVSSPCWSAAAALLGWLDDRFGAGGPRVPRPPAGARAADASRPGC